MWEEGDFLHRYTKVRSTKWEELTWVDPLREVETNKVIPDLDGAIKVIYFWELVWPAVTVGELVMDEGQPGW